MGAQSSQLQTTKGVCLDNSSVAGHHVLVVDVKGRNTGDQEQEEDTISFETQTSVFALAVADVLLVNIWAKDICFGMPLLKMVLQVGAYVSLART